MYKPSTHCSIQLEVFSVTFIHFVWTSEDAKTMCGLSLFSSQMKTDTEELASNSIALCSCVKGGHLRSLLASLHGQPVEGVSFNAVLSLPGKCKVDETEKGWFITYIDRDPETIERQKVCTTMKQLVDIKQWI